VIPLESIPLIDRLLGDHAGELGDDFVPYRNHCFRIANFALAEIGLAFEAVVGPESDLRPAAGPASADPAHAPSRVTPETVEKIAIAAAFHDLGIWTDRTFDYLEPSVRLAETWLEAQNLAAWRDEIAAMIRFHHKLTRWRGDSVWLVETFRRADWTDVTFGLRRYGASRLLVRQLYDRFPDAGFHRLLVRLELRHLRRHPLNPLPVLKF
jgi:hypothetical protein